MAVALSFGMIESAAIHRVEAYMPSIRSWLGTCTTESFDTLDAKLCAPWPTYTGFWNDVFVADKVEQQAREDRILQDLPNPLSDILLITRTQVAHVPFRIPEDQDRLNHDFFHDGVRFRCDASLKMEELLESGQVLFDCVALSVSPGKYDGRLLDAAIYLSNDNGQHVEEERKSCFGDSGGYCIKPLLNFLVVEKDNHYSRRIGLGHMYLKQWLSLGAEFETVILT